ncbi:unnamed protein product [Adineta steineri]|uniref:Uncharacterized protein n=1 Tax=Adineta steineri TaxID=433720 RepID=A0A815DTE8_9BILA|nr:unnamed protein product [Adineta steineri]CAF1575584.1 unnamed protein product [Adineta steineri]
MLGQGQQHSGDDGRWNGIDIGAVEHGKNMKRVLLRVSGNARQIGALRILRVQGLANRVNEPSLGGMKALDFLKWPPWR